MMSVVLLRLSKHLQNQIGTDIEDFKCSWLVVKALELSNFEQKQFLYDNYGKADPSCVANVKQLYKDLNLEVFLHHFFLLSIFDILFGKKCLCFFYVCFLYIWSIFFMINSLGCICWVWEAELWEANNLHWNSSK